MGVASTWDDRKGLDDFIELSNVIAKKFQIVLIGLSAKQIKSLPANIIGIKRTENIQELVVWYNKALAFVNLTYQDNFPTTNLEALACGTPVITYRTGGSPEAIDDKTGFVINKGNVDEIVDAIHEVETKGKDKYSYECRSRAERLYNKEDRFKDYINLYQEILNRDE